ncbi:MAG: hypothetical protein IH598_17360 [Bacteroidales bacterium]|nr:hypothetical protein [Bacteroidales bacterium]
MKNSKSNRLLAMTIIALSINSQSLLSQCISCDSTQSNVTVGFNNNYSSNWWQQTILGNYNTTSQNNTVVIGTSSTASRSHSYIFGSYSQSNGLHSYVIGSNSIADKTDNFAIGNTAQSMSGNGFAIGNYTKSLAEGAYVLGLGRSITIPLEHNVKNSLAVGFKSNIPTLFVSESPNVNRTGRIGIGNVTDPQAKLHIRADAEDDATMYLEATGTLKYSRLLFTNEHFIQARNGQNLTFNTQKETHFTFQNGTIRSVNGSATAPAYSFSDNNNTGMFKFGTNSLAFSIGGTQKVAIASEGLTVSGFAITSSGYKVNQYTVINSSRDYTGRNGIYSGNVGIGIPNPAKKLEVNGDINLTGNLFINNQLVNIQNPWTINGDQIHYAGQVAIGTSDPGEYKLAVKGHVRAEEVVVELMDTWPDYVFENDYPLMRLDELQTFISENNHLPGVPSSQQISEEGISLGEMNALLLKKIEELTLYILKQEERISTLENVVNRENE